MRWLTPIPPVIVEASSKDQQAKGTGVVLKTRHCKLGVFNSQRSILHAKTTAIGRCGRYLSCPQPWQSQDAHLRKGGRLRSVHSCLARRSSQVLC